jgi:drug/metabolite transporter (DMT)-like permease
VVVGELGAVLTNVAIATSPVFAIIGGMLLLRERLSLKLALAVTLTLFGVLLAVLGSG